MKWGSHPDDLDKMNVEELTALLERRTVKFIEWRDNLEREMQQKITDLYWEFMQQVAPIKEKIAQKGNKRV